MTPQERRAKSRYYYLAGSKEYALDNYDKAFDLYKRAYETDTSYLEAGMSYASLLAMIYNDSAYLADKIYPMMKRYVDYYPEDFQEGLRYARGIIEAPVANYMEGARVVERILKIYPSKTDYYGELASMYLQADSLDLARDALLRYERIEGRNELSLRYQAGICLAQNDTLGAKNMADEYVATKPLNYKAWVMRANIYGALQEMDSVKTSLLRAQALEPDNSDIKTEFVNYYLTVGDSIMADQKVKEILTAIDIDAQQKSDYLYQYIVYNYSPEEINTFSPRISSLYQALAGHEGDDISVLECGLSLTEYSDRYDLSDKISRSLIAINPTNTNYWNSCFLANFKRNDMVGNSAVLQQLYDEAQQALGEPPVSMLLLLYLSYDFDGNLQQAINIARGHIEELIPGYDITTPAEDLNIDENLSKEDITNISVWLQMYADKLTAANDTASSYKVYEQSLYLNPDNALTLNNYAYFMASNSDDSDLNKCLELSQRAISIEPNNGTYLDTYAYILFKQKAYDRAKLYQEMAIEKMESSESENSELYDHYGDILFMCHEYEKAVEAWQKALELDPNNELIQRKVSNKMYYQK
jgi:tetratricopeptide (TPR) repeat protein